MDRVRHEIRQRVERELPGSAVEPITGDASTRRFYRLRPVRGNPCVIMDYGASFTGETDDIRLARVFLDAGLPVARVLEAWPEEGCLLLEDLGPTTLETALKGAGRDESRELFERAVRLAADVAERGTPSLARSERAAGPALDSERFRFEMDFFLENYVGWLRGQTASEDLKRELHGLADAAAAGPRSVLCHRDYHSRNLMLLPDRSLAMVDIQDARWGPDSYDLASLLRDAYADLEESEVEPLIRLYLGALADPPPYESFRTRFDLVAAERMIKALGTFGYQVAVRGSDRYRPAITRTLARLANELPRLDRFPRLASHFSAVS